MRGTYRARNKLTVLILVKLTKNLCLPLNKVLEISEQKIDISFAIPESAPCKCPKNMFHSYLNCEVSRPDFVSTSFKPRYVSFF